MTGTTVTVDAAALAIWVSLIISLAGIVAAAARWITRTMQRQIRQATQPIQPDANGGASLPDIAAQVRALAVENERGHTRLHTRIDGLSSDVRDLQKWAITGRLPDPGGERD